MKILEDKPLVFLGDHHGDWNSILRVINAKAIENVYIISVGDLGVGFKPNSKDEYKMSKTLSDIFEEKNIHFCGIRGNHDNPLFFSGENRIVYSNFELIEDYSTYKYKDKTIQFIGGAISIDRTGRQIGVSYWENEGVTFEKGKLEKVDILVTHTTPSWCFPQNFNQIVYGWAAEDAYLIEDLTDERAVMDEIFKISQPTFHFYGHFHSSWMELVNGCKHKLLDINEFYELQN